MIFLTLFEDITFLCLNSIRFLLNIIIFLIIFHPMITLPTSKHHFKSSSHDYKIFVTLIPQSCAHSPHPLQTFEATTVLKVGLVDPLVV